MKKILVALVLVLSGCSTTPCSEHQAEYSVECYSGERLIFTARMHTHNNNGGFYTADGARVFYSGNCVRMSL